MKQHENCTRNKRPCIFLVGHECDYPQDLIKRPIPWCEEYIPEKKQGELGTNKEEVTL